MTDDSEPDGIPLLAQSDDDPRLTPIGKWLRNHHLDEMPQMWNIFVGDMSFVGYRPERRYFIDKIMERDPRYVRLFETRPGLTSYAALYNGYTNTMEKMLQRLEYDLEYLEKRSCLLDLKILCLTLVRATTGER